MRVLAISAFAITVIVALITTTFNTLAEAGMRCSTDYFGNTTCTGTGSSSGYNTRSSTDYFGNTTIRDNYGNSMRCSRDYFGNVNCN